MLSSSHQLQSRHLLIVNRWNCGRCIQHKMKNSNFRRKLSMEHKYTLAHFLRKSLFKITIPQWANVRLVVKHVSDMHSHLFALDLHDNCIKSRQIPRIYLILNSRLNVKKTKSNRSNEIAVCDTMNLTYFLRNSIDFWRPTERRIKA